jgi:uncharacterized phage-associated protein
MGTNIFDVAHYVLKRVDDLTAMKLQKLVYYCQGYSLGWDDLPLFEEDFEAWANGPVAPALFAIHQGRFRIPKNLVQKHRSGAKFTKDERETMDAIIEAYGGKSSLWLSGLTHREPPWRDARKNTPDGERCSAIITKHSMQEYYGSIVGEE